MKLLNSMNERYEIEEAEGIGAASRLLVDSLEDEIGNDGSCTLAIGPSSWIEPDSAYPVDKHRAQSG